MNIGDRPITPEHPPYVIAEIGVNHDGAVDRGIALIEAAQAAGADAIKLQMFQARRLLSSAAMLARYQADAGAGDAAALLQSLELDTDALRTLVEHARACGMDPIVTVFSVELVPDAESLDVAAYKIASPDLINRPLLEALAATGRSLLVSTGAATLAEVAETTRWLGARPHLLMQCVSAYPTRDDDAAIGGLRALCRVSPRALGYSDHTTAVDTGALAVAAGACVLEKHLTYNRRASGPDHAASLDPEQFTEYVRLAHRAWRMFGPAEKRVLEVEEDVRLVSRQSLTTTRDLSAGHVLSRDDLTIKRPGIGLPPAMLREIVGRPTRRAIAADMPLVEGDVA